MKRFGFVGIVLELVAAVILSLVTSCSGDGSVYKLQYPKFSFSPYTFSTGETSGYAEVTFLTPDDVDFPKVVELNGAIYNVAIIRMTATFPTFKRLILTTVSLRSTATPTKRLPTSRRCQYRT